MASLAEQRQGVNQSGDEEILLRVEKAEPAEGRVMHPVRIEIDKNTCMKCYNCVRACTVFDSVYEIGEDGYPYAARVEDCIMCLICHTVCPPRAIKHIGIRPVTILLFDRDVADRMTHVM